MGLTMKEAYKRFLEAKRALIKAQGQRDLAERAYQTAVQDYYRYQHTFLEAAEKEAKKL